MSLYVYALLGDAPAASLGQGLAGEPLRLLSLCDGLDLFAVVGELEGGSPPGPSADAIRGHDQAIRRLTDISRAVLPARFGSISTDEALSELVAQRAPSVRAALTLVEGCDQMTLRVYEARPDMRATVGAAAEVDTAAPSGPGTRYLAARMRERHAAQQVPEIDPVRRAAAALLRGERCERHPAPVAAGASPILLASVYHLVPRGQADAYAEAVRAVAGDLAVKVTASGPWPPYAFAAEALGT